MWVLNGQRNPINYDITNKPSLDLLKNFSQYQFDIDVNFQGTLGDRLNVVEKDPEKAL